MSLYGGRSRVRTIPTHYIYPTIGSCITEVVQLRTELIPTRVLFLPSSRLSTDSVPSILQTDKLPPLFTPYRASAIAQSCIFVIQKLLLKELLFVSRYCLHHLSLSLPPRPNRIARTQQTMAKWFRSEDMSYVSIIVNEDAAHTCISDLGKLGMIQFTDLNPDLTAFQRRYVAYIKRIDELERKLSFFGEEVRFESVVLVRAYARSLRRACGVKLCLTFH